MVGSKQVTCGIQNQRQEVCCACWDHHAFVPISWTCKEQTAVSHSSAESEIISLDAGLRIDGLPVLQFWECVLETLSCKTAKGNVTNARESFRFIRILAVVFLSQLTTPNIPTSSHSAQHCLFEDVAAVIRMINRGRRSNQRHVTRTHRVDVDLTVFERLHLAHSLFDEVRANKRSIGGYFNRGNVHHDAMAFIFEFVAKSDEPHESRDVRSFFS